MAKNKISEFSSNPANNTDIANIDIAEGCAPSGVNNAIRELMAQLKDMQTGVDGDPFTVGGNFTAEASSILAGEIVVNGVAGTAGQVLTSRGNGVATIWKDAFVTGMILLWSGSVATIPSGWLLCDGTNSTPDLRNRFVIGAATDSGGAPSTTVTGSATQAGGSKDAVVVSHNHTGTTATAGAHRHLGLNSLVQGQQSNSGSYNSIFDNYNQFLLLDATREPTNALTSEAGSHNHTFTTDSTGVSATNANLPPYYALAYIMKA